MRMNSRRPVVYFFDGATERGVICRAPRAMPHLDLHLVIERYIIGAFPPGDSKHSIVYKNNRTASTDVSREKYAWKIQGRITLSRISFSMNDHDQ